MSGSVLVEADSFRLLAAWGLPVLRIEIPGLGGSRAVWLSTNLDGSLWTLGWHGADFCCPAEYTSPFDAHTPGRVEDVCRPRNVHGLSETQIHVLAGLRRAGAWGMIDHEHDPMPVEAAVQARRHLHTIGLVAERPGFTRTTPAGSRGQVWIITAAGEQALRDPRPPLAFLLSRARAQLAS